MTELISAADARVKTLNAGKEEEQALVAGEINKAATKGFFETFIAKVSDELIETLRGLGYVVNKVKKGVRIAWDYIAPEYKPVTSGAAVNELLAGTDPIVYATFDTSVTINEGEIPTVPAGKELHVQIAEGATISCAKTAFDVQDGGTLILEGAGTIAATQASNGSLVQATGKDAKVIIDGVTMDITTNLGNSTANYCVYLAENASVEVKSGIMKTGAGACITTNNTTGGASKIYIKGGELYSNTAYAIYMPSQSNVEIIGGKVQGINARMGQFLIHGDAEIINTAQTAEAYDRIGDYITTSGMIWLGDTIAVLAGTYDDPNGTDLMIRVYENAKVESDFRAAIGVYKLDTKQAQNVEVFVNNKANVTTTDEDFRAIMLYDHDYIAQDAEECSKTYTPVADSTINMQ